MSTEIAVVGDVHGNLAALRAILRASEDSQPKQFVFVGDYINRGPDSNGVLEELIELRRRRPNTTLLRGNHDEELSQVLSGTPIGKFLAMGGTTTLTSYVGRPGHGDLAAQLRSAVPITHRDLLCSLAPMYRYGKLVVSHGDKPIELRRDDFHVFGHTVRQNRYPQISRGHAAIDTGCSTIPGGRLSCLLWPSLRVIQVSDLGNLVTG
ncbi:metallophosphoesterase [Pseudonocardia ailaonensis]|uniref:metallophosphoesterase n=1 Tax=Pseudonocardia ailaonensis TaxID=367279 RepID=UPI003CD091E7